MKVKVLIGIILFVAVGMMASPNLSAEEKKFVIHTADTNKSVLERQMGRVVTVKLQSGDYLEGTLTKVGDHLIHLSGASGAEFYDAVIRIDGIIAVIIKVKGN